jgi:hypothetical protein
LTYATNGVYVAFFFMYYVKRRYGAWYVFSSFLSSFVRE